MQNECLNVTSKKVPKCHLVARKAAVVSSQIHKNGHLIPRWPFHKT